MMATQKINVLVFTGTGTTIESVKHCLFSLRRLLSPNYAVIPVSEAALLKEPWAPSCALLVIPGGGDLGYCRVLNGEGNRRIANFVRRGGAYLGFCAGGYYGSRRCEFEVGDPALEVIGRRELAFFPGTCRGGAFSGFAYHSEAGARAAKLQVQTKRFSMRDKAARDGEVDVSEEVVSYYNGGGVFVDADKMEGEGVEVLATYEDELDVDASNGNAAVVYCKVGDGAAILTGPHPEFAAINLHPQPAIPSYAALIQTLAAHDEARTNFLKACLAKLGLRVSKGVSAIPSLSTLHLSSIHHVEVEELLFAFQDVLEKQDGEEFLRGENDLFHIEKRESRWAVGDLKSALAAGDGPAEDAAAAEDDKSSRSSDSITDYATITKSIVPHGNAWPDLKETPNFQHGLFYSSLKEYRALENDAEEWGNVFMYGEVVTSTNTLLEKNPKLLAKLPTGFTLAATTQVAGRGRGTNVWVAPPGSLITSTVINHPAHLFTSRPIVFVQYLAAVAIVEAIKSYGDGYDVVPVKLKWPNDIYALDPTKPASPPSYVKIGGILSNLAFSQGAYQVVLGIGINTTNGQPTTSLNALLPPHLAPFRIERLVARILTRLEGLYAQFRREGFSADLEGRYYRHWLHSGQEVTLENEGGVRARILGITRDWGMLKAEELDGAGRRTGRMWALQSDENSFDFWRGLVRRKM